jgi:cystathionine beta-lyase family protein involved in aluminum resistance
LFFNKFSITIIDKDNDIRILCFKNPGGGLAKIGGYIAGNKDLIERCGYRLTAPGIGKEAGASLNSLQDNHNAQLNPYYQRYSRLF